MELIFAAALCSVAVSILLKICKEKGFNTFQMIAWNYAAASILCFLWFKPDLQHISMQHTPWWLILILGILLPSIFLCLAKSLQTAGILKTEIAQRLSVVLSLMAAYFVFQEQFSQLKVIGVVLGLSSVLCILLSHRTDAERTEGPYAILYLTGVWVGYALIDVLLKYTTGLGLQFSVALNLVFIYAFALSILYTTVRHKSIGAGRDIFAGLGLGVLNFANIALYVKAHMLLKDTPAVVFAGMNILVVMFGVLSGLVIFKEKLRIWSGLGVCLGIVSVLCLAYTMF